jgi:hypothetical protein
MCAKRRANLEFPELVEFGLCPPLAAEWLTMHCTGLVINGSPECVIKLLVTNVESCCAS